MDLTKPVNLIPLNVHIGQFRLPGSGSILTEHTFGYTHVGLTTKFGPIMLTLELRVMSHLCVLPRQLWSFS